VGGLGLLVIQLAAGAGQGLGAGTVRAGLQLEDAGLLFICSLDLFTIVVVVFILKQSADLEEGVSLGSRIHAIVSQRCHGFYT